MVRKSQKAREDKDGWQERVKRRERIRTDGKKESKGERGKGRMARKSQKGREDKDGRKEGVKGRERIRKDGEKDTTGRKRERGEEE